jgi:hypothetical protein
VPKKGSDTGVKLSFLLHGDRGLFFAATLS